MEIVYETYDACPCIQKINTFLAHRQQTGFRELGTSSVICCDCGQNWQLQEDVNGRVWFQVEPMIGYRK